MAGMRLRTTSLFVLATALAVAGSRPESRIPVGLPSELATTLEADRAYTRLGREMFHDPILSRDRSVSCSSCHDPNRGLSDRKPLSLGIDGQLTERNTPTLLNRALGQHFSWDGRADSLETQVLLPIENPREMGIAVDEVVARLQSIPAYVEKFQEVGLGRPTRETLAKVLAAFVRAQLVGDSPVDHFRAGDGTALSNEARQGLWLFESRGRCWRCHSGPNFSDESFHATGVGAKDGQPEEGRFRVTRDESDRGRFKTPTLRGLAQTAPYMHDGSLATLRDVVEFYSRGGNADALPHPDPELAKLDLSENDKRHLIAFLEALSQTVAGK